MVIKDRTHRHTMIVTDENGEQMEVSIYTSKQGITASATLEAVNNIKKVFDFLLEEDKLGERRRRLFGD